MMNHAKLMDRSIYKTFSYADIALFDSPLKDQFHSSRDNLIDKIKNDKPTLIELYKKRHPEKTPENFWALLSYLMADYFSNNIDEIEKELNVKLHKKNWTWLDSSDSVSSPWLSLNESYRNISVKILFKIAPCMLLDTPPKYSKILIAFKFESNQNKCFTIEEIISIITEFFTPIKEVSLEYIYGKYCNTLNALKNYLNQNEFDKDKDILLKRYNFNLQYLGVVDKYNKCIYDIVESYKNKNDFNINDVIKSEIGKKFTVDLLRLTQDNIEEIQKSKREYRIMTFNPISSKINTSLQNTSYHSFFLKYTTPTHQCFNGVVNSTEDVILREKSKIRSNISIMGL